MRSMRVKWEPIGDDPDCMRMQCDGPLFMYQPMPMVTCHACLMEDDPSPEQRELIASLEGILGVIRIAVAKYSVAVAKGGVYDWDEIKPKVEHIVSDWLGMSLPQPPKTNPIIGEILQQDID